MNRRTAIGVLLAPVAGRSEASRGASGWGDRKRYRIDATITLLGMTVFSRREVGWASGEIQNKAGQVRFRIAGASLPERTRGIRICGRFEETLETRGERKSDYFGFLSAPVEAKPSRSVLANLERNPAGTGACCVVEGQWSQRAVSFRKSYEVAVPEEALDPCGDEFAARMRRGLETKCATARLQSCFHGQEGPRAGYTFLSALLEAARPEQKCLNLSYHYGDTILALETRTFRDEGKAGYQVRAQARGRGLHRFQFECEAAERLPSRIEYHPKPWLQLTLVALVDAAKERA